MYKRFIPSSLKILISNIRLLNNVFKTYKYDAKRYYKYSNIKNVSSTEIKLIARIIERYHVIEKGLTMPKIRYGFGKEVMILLIRDCLDYFERYGYDNTQFQHAVGVILEYKEEHEQNNQKINEIVFQEINSLLSTIPNVTVTKQTSMTKAKYFQNIDSAFDKFSQSRHSLRNFNGSVPIETIEKAIQLSQNAPSACNRQPTRVYIIDNKVTIESLLKLQTGNRGFGHLADKLLVLTAEVSGYGGVRERNLPYIDAGIYTMNLLYALHFHKVGACTLNWCDSPIIDQQIREIIELPPSEAVIICIACGNVPESFKLTTSKRKKMHQVTTII